MAERAKRQGIQLAYPLEDKRLIKWGFPVLAQPKYDGERGLLSQSSGLVSSEAHQIISLPHILFEYESLHLSLTLDGELYYHGLSREEIHSIISRRVNFHPLSYMMEFHVFDVKIPDTPQMERLRILNGLNFRPGGPIKKIPTEFLKSFEDVDQACQRYIALGFEGIILRHPGGVYKTRRSTEMMKWKPRCWDEYVIMGFEEEVSISGVKKGALGSLRVADSDGRLFSVGSGLTREERERYWEEKEKLVGRVVRIAYQHTSDGGIPIHPVFDMLIGGELK